MSKTVHDGEHRHLVQVLIEARRASGLTQAQLGAKVGKNQAFISVIENGQRRVDTLEFVLLAKAMGADPRVLFDKLLTKLSSKPSSQQ